MVAQSPRVVGRRDDFRRSFQAQVGLLATPVAPTLEEWGGVGILRGVEPVEEEAQGKRKRIPYKLQISLVFQPESAIMRMAWEIVSSRFLPFKKRNL